ncbi:MAG: DUF2059 domain-containing protein [Okeania sp. SIO2C2]|uniref:DUF2059 domain-containing protein n=1 Tax=Okeania sp. SIO2C2 TaxID=2607787 RepID=UPI0013BAECF1|nr:DUF2059 domain-containing protein [Okeania sp. SIO2C2]NEP88512.1 DUF2059 domain-containing protein [Okeania sp. SIO2C2]
MLKQIFLISLTSSLFFLNSEVSNPQIFPNYSESNLRVSQKTSTRKQQLIDRYLELIGGEKTFQEVIRAMLSQMEQQFSSILTSELVENQQLSPEERQQITNKLNQETTSIIRKSNQMFLERISYQQIVEEVYYPIYDKYFTEEDLQTLIEFYQTPTGRKTIELLPQLFQESMQRTAQVLNPKIKSVMQEIIAEELQRIN